MINAHGKHPWRRQPVDQFTDNCGLQGASLRKLAKEQGKLLLGLGKCRQDWASSSTNDGFKLDGVTGKAENEDYAVIEAFKRETGNWRLALDGFGLEELMGHTGDGGCNDAGVVTET